MFSQRWWYKTEKIPRFAEAKLAEIEELVKKGTYEFVKEDDIPLGATVLQFRFVLTIKKRRKPRPSTSKRDC